MPVIELDGFHCNLIQPGCCKYNYRAAAGCGIQPSCECVLKRHREREGKKNKGKEKITEKRQTHVVPVCQNKVTNFNLHNAALLESSFV